MPELTNLPDDFFEQEAGYKPPRTAAGQDLAEQRDTSAFNIPKEFIFDPVRDQGLSEDLSQQKARAYTQPWTEQLGRGLGRAALNIIPSIIGNAASIIDFEDYWNQDKEVGNAVTRAMEDLKQSTNEAMPIYRENPGQPLDMGDSGWWYENGSQIAESAAAFVITGYGLGAGLTKGAQALRWMLSLGKTTELTAGMRGATALLNATGLNQAEGMTTAIGVYDKILEQGKEQGLDEKTSMEKAADAAAYSININRANILLNLTSAAALMKSPGTTRALIKRMGAAKAMGLEGAQEYTEEVVNLYAERMGMAAGEDLLAGDENQQSFSLTDIAELATTPEGLEAGILGAFGGIAQTGGTKAIQALSRDQATQERENSQKEYIKNLETILQENNVPNLTNTMKAAASTAKRVEQKMALLQKEELTEADERMINALDASILRDQAKYAFDLGTTESLLDMYEKIEQLSPEQAAAKGYTAEQLKEDSPLFYKTKAKDVKKNILNLEKIYQRSQKYENSDQIFKADSDIFFIEQETQRVQGQKQETQAALQKRIDAMNQYTSDIKEVFDMNDVTFKEISEDEKQDSLKDDAFVKKNFSASVPLSFVNNADLKGKKVDMGAIFGGEFEESMSAAKVQAQIKKKYKVYDEVNKCLIRAYK